MKKLIRFLVATVAIFLLLIPCMSALADNGTASTAMPASGTTYTDLVIDNIASIVQTIIVTLIGVLGAWLSVKLSATAKFKNINTATQSVIKAAQLTAGELKQTVVDGLKAAHSDGKLTESEISELKSKLLNKTLEKLADPAVQLLSSAQIDVEALISGAGEAWIEEIKRDPQILKSELLTTD